MRAFYGSCVFFLRKRTVIKASTDYDFSSFNEDDWYVDGSTGRLWKNTEGDDIYEETDLMIGHFPLHYILVCFGFSLMIALLFSKF